jgi:hypothetical protein
MLTLQDENGEVIDFKFLGTFELSLLAHWLSLQDMWLWLGFGK